MLIVLWVAGIAVGYLVFDLLAFVVEFGMVDSLEIALSLHYVVWLFAFRSLVVACVLRAFSGLGW